MGYVIGNIAGNVAVLSTKATLFPARIAAIAQWFEQLACIQPMAVQSRPSGSKLHDIGGGTAGVSSSPGRGRQGPSRAIIAEIASAM